MCLKIKLLKIKNKGFEQKTQITINNFLSLVKKHSKLLKIKLFLLNNFYKNNKIFFKISFF